MVWTIITYYALDTTKNIIWWSGGQLVYLVTPTKFYNWMFPSQSEADRVVSELRQIRMELHDLNNRKLLQLLIL